MTSQTEQISKEINLLPRQERTLTDRQKRMIRERDNNRCQFPEPHNCNDHEQTPHVHHVTPFGVATRVMGKSATAADHPNNLLTVCEDIHVGGRRNPPEQTLHPDVPKARRNYARGNKQAFQEMYVQREQAMKEGRPYHRSDIDTEMKILAHVNTREAEKEGRFNMDKFISAGKRSRRSGPTT